MTRRTPVNLPEVLAVARTCWLAEQVKHLRARLHCVNHEFVPAVENENDSLQKATMVVEAQPKLSGRTVVIEVFDPQ